MSRLVNPGTGTVVHVEGDLDALYRSRGWRDADAPAEPVEVPPEKPRTRRRSTKTD